MLSCYQYLLPDSRKRSKKDNLYIFDSTGIALFQEILKASGLSCSDGKRKGSIKVHTLLHSVSDAPTMVRYSLSAQSDVTFLKHMQLPCGSVIVFDKGCLGYRSYTLFTHDGVTFVTRNNDRSVYQIVLEHAVNTYQQKMGIQKDQLNIMGYPYNKKAVQVPSRLITYTDPHTQKQFQFLTSNITLAPLTIANFYRQRWRIEIFFKRIKQNYPLHYFQGDNEYAIKIQIWVH